MSSKFFIYFLFCIITSNTNSLRKLKEENLSDDIIILHTNDVHCSINDYIGYDGLNLYKKELQTTHKHVLLVDAGDHIQGAIIGLVSKGKDIIDIMNFVEYDVVTIGNHEFDYKLEQLNKLATQLNPGYICANFCYRKTKKPIFNPYKIIEVGNKKIGFIGVNTPQALTKTYLHSLVDEDGKTIYDFLTENNGQELASTIQGYINELRNKQKVDNVFILAHLGMGEDAQEQFTSRGLLSRLEGVDAVIDGHTHKVYNQTYKDKNGKDIYMSQTGSRLRHVGKITIKPEGTIISEIIDEIPLPENYKDYMVETRNGTQRYVDSKTYAFLRDKIDAHDGEFNEYIGYSDFDLNYTINGELSCRLEENTLGDLITDALRHYGQSDVAFINGGSIRDNLLKGKIIYKNILDVLSFSTNIIVKEIYGKDIIDALEYGMRLLPRRTSRFPQVSGIKFKVDVSIKSPVIIDNDESFVRVEGERRVYDVYVGDKKIEEDKLYKVTFDEYLGSGGDGYSMFKKYKIFKDTKLVDNEILKRYIIYPLNRTIPNEYRKTQGRIVKMKKDLRSDDIIILHTNDVHCAINDHIGYDGLNLYKKELQTTHKHVLLVDAGDHIQGGIIGLISKGEDIIDIMNFINYDVVTLGNHEFDYKIEQLNKLAGQLNTGYICANFCYRKNKSTIFKPYKIVEVGDKKIGFVGVNTPQALTKSYLHSVLDEDGKPLYDFLTEDNGWELAHRIQGYIRELRIKEGADYVFILSHLGFGGDAIEEYTSRGLLSRLEGVDAVIDGHTHKVYNQTFKDKNGKDVYMTQTGYKLQNVGKITIKPDGKITSEIIDGIPKPENYNNYYKLTRNAQKRYVDRDAYIKMETIINSHSREFNEFIGYSDFDLNITIKGEQRIRKEENTLGDLVADALRHFGNADISMINAGSIRENLLKGNITYKNILDVLPFSASIIVKEVTGQTILDALEFGMRSLPGTTSRFPQVSGIKFKVDDTIKTPVVIDKDENFLKCEGERRVYDVYVGNEKLDQNKKYKISFDDYLGDGGDGFSMFHNYRISKDTNLVDNEVFKRYIIQVLNRRIPDIYKTSQGRIVKKKKDNNNNKKSSSYFIKYYKGFYLLILCLLL